MNGPATGNGRAAAAVTSGAAVPSPAAPADTGGGPRRAAHDLAVAADRLVDQVAHWTPARWASVPTEADGGATRAELVYGLVQMLADLGAEAEDRPRRPVPRLDNDLSLPDQLRVMVHDLLAATTDERPLREAAALVNAARLAL